MNTFPFTVQPGQTVTVLNMLVKTIRYDTGDAGGLDTTIRVKSISGGTLDAKLKPGDLMVLPQMIEGIVITSAAGITGLSGELTLGTGTLQSNRVVGEVSVIDGEVAKSLAGQAFTGFVAVGPVAAQFAYMQIWNPAASGKRVIVSDVLFSSQVANVYALKKHNVQAGATVFAQSKITTGAVSSAVIGSGNAGVMPGTTLEICYNFASNPLPRYFKQPYILDEGWGLFVHANVANTDLYAAIQFTEEPL